MSAKRPKDDTPLAGLCFALAVTLGLIALYAASTRSWAVVAALVGLALISVVTGRQRLAQTRLKLPVFKTLVRNLGIATAAVTLALAMFLP